MAGFRSVHLPLSLGCTSLFCLWSRSLVLPSWSSRQSPGSPSLWVCDSGPANGNYVQPSNDSLCKHQGSISSFCCSDFWRTQSCLHSFQALYLVGKDQLYCRLTRQSPANSQKAKYSWVSTSTSCVPVRPHRPVQFESVTCSLLLLVGLHPQSFILRCLHLAMGEEIGEPALFLQLSLIKELWRKPGETGHE